MKRPLFCWPRMEKRRPAEHPKKSGVALQLPARPKSSACVCLGVIWSCLSLGAVRGQLGSDRMQLPEMSKVSFDTMEGSEHGRYFYTFWVSPNHWGVKSILNTDKESDVGNGTHWVACYQQGKTICLWFFCSSSVHLTQKQENYVVKNDVDIGKILNYNGKFFRNACKDAHKIIAMTGTPFITICIFNTIFKLLDDWKKFRHHKNNFIN